MKLYHYTTVENARSILVIGWLMPSSAGLPEHEKPALWFSIRTDYEPTALKLCTGNDGARRRLELNEQINMAGLARFSIDAKDRRLMAWSEACKAVGTRRKDREALESYGRRIGGNPLHWFASLDAISVSDLTAEIWNKETGVFEAFQQFNKVDV